MPYIRDTCRCAERSSRYRYRGDRAAFSSDECAPAGSRSPGPREDTSDKSADRIRSARNRRVDHVLSKDWFAQNRNYIGYRELPREQADIERRRLPAANVDIYREALVSRFFNADTVRSFRQLDDDSVLSRWSLPSLAVDKHACVARLHTDGECPGPCWVGEGSGGSAPDWRHRAWHRRWFCRIAGSERHQRVTNGVA